MGAVVDLDGLLDQRHVWRGRQAQPRSLGLQPTGHVALDARLPEGGWPAAALSELLLASPGCGELQLLWPTLARLTGEGNRVVLVSPPFIAFPPAWEAAGIDLRWLVQVQARPDETLWAAEQCLRSGSCAAVLCWPERADDRALRRLQVAAETGEAMAFACRPQPAALNPSPAALRIAIDTRPAQWRVLKCRGGLVPAAPICAPARG
ncbi:translesion DNA synthesis-associated protein ImuA [Pseudomonas sp. S75]|uniref:translesion DNA synthesis-associated protein ImuA n=1 Tax=unclassified Pseudomonas TaxID=196821 RepID=UPI001906C2B5|nr:MULTISPECIES: translesion DNA synthesis-associated protein ImuA [unclassified Pseudomonas]MBJ9974264.1 translesion DNA synthesis-associated protein ImuA [Pseudomonas sp. S30]MBK0151806.1 translesion DNA synthesis-associated protein ImuA [Pseudomonas sp. S75]